MTPLTGLLSEFTAGESPHHVASCFSPFIASAKSMLGAQLAWAACQSKSVHPTQDGEKQGGSGCTLLFLPWLENLGWRQREDDGSQRGHAPCTLWRAKGNGLFPSRLPTGCDQHSGAAVLIHSSAAAGQHRASALRLPFTLCQEAQRGWRKQETSSAVTGCLLTCFSV